MNSCVRGCVHWRRHSRECPVEDRGSGAWVPWEPNAVMLDCVCNADLSSEYRSHVHVTKTGHLDIWHPCDGCAPRKALHGALCEQCHLRLQGWLGVGVGSLRWAYRWIAPDLEPSQNAAPSGKIRQGKRVPPAAMALHVHVLREDITHYVRGWLDAICDQFTLVGPDHRSVFNSGQYLATWLDRIEDVPELVEPMWGEAEALMRRVAAQAPWEPKRQRLPGLQCPECEREALFRAEGDEHLTCRRCNTLVPRAKYDRWAFMLTAEREEKVG